MPQPPGSCHLSPIRSLVCLLSHPTHELPALPAAVPGTGAAVVAVSPDPVPHLAEFAYEGGATSPLLSDEDSSFIRGLGILNDLIGPDEPRYGIPFPGVYALSADGTVHRKYFHQHYREHTAPRGILLDAYGLSLAPTALPTARAEVNEQQIVATLASERLTPFEHTPLSIQVAGGAESLVRIQGLDPPGQSPKIA